MATYDYKSGKKRIEEIILNKLDVIERDDIPSDDKFTFDNGYYSWVTGIFIDIRNSSSIFANEDKEKVSKMVRCFTSEIIEILREDDNLREIAELRLENPDMSLVDLGKLLKQPVGKSGVNYRLKKIMEIADEG